MMKLSGRKKEISLNSFLCFFYGFIFAISYLKHLFMHICHLFEWNKRFLFFFSRLHLSFTILKDEINPQTKKASAVEEGTTKWRFDCWRLNSKTRIERAVRNTNLSNTVFVYTLKFSWSISLWILIVVFSLKVTADKFHLLHDFLCLKKMLSIRKVVLC